MSKMTSELNQGVLVKVVHQGAEITWVDRLTGTPCYGTLTLVIRTTFRAGTLSSKPIVPQDSTARTG